MPSEVAPHYFPSLDCSLTTSPPAQIFWIFSSFSRPMSIVGRAFHDTDPHLRSGVRWRDDRDRGARWIGRGSRLVRCPQSETLDEFRMNFLLTRKDERGAGCIWCPTRFLNSFLYKPESRFFMKHISHSNLPLPREDSSPYSIGKVDGGFINSMVSAIIFLGKYSPK